MSSTPASSFVRDLLVGTAAPGTDVAWEQVERLVRHHGLEGLAISRQRAAQGRLLPAPMASRLEPEYRRVALWTTLLVEAGTRARQALGDAGVPSLMFKGAALVAAGLYPDPGARRMDDVDLLVSPERAGAAVTALTGAGFLPWKPWDRDRPGWLDSASFVDPDSPPGLPVSLDLHWRVGYGRLRFGGPAEGRAAGGGSSGKQQAEPPLWEGADREQGLPAAEPHLVAVAEHVLKHLRVHVHLQAVGDLARLAAAVRDWDTVGRLAHSSPLSAGIGHLLAGLASESPAPVPRELTRTLVGGAPFAHPLRSRLRPSVLVETASSRVHSRPEGLLLRWQLLGSPGEVARDLAHAAFPGRDWLRARYGGDASLLRLHYRYATDVLRWLTHRARSPASPNQDLLP